MLLRFYLILILDFTCVVVSTSNCPESVEPKTKAVSLKATKVRFDAEAIRTYLFSGALAFAVVDGSRLGPAGLGHS